MATSVLDQRQILESSFGETGLSGTGDLAGRIASLEGEIRKSREENTKREESLRFFLNSIESRLKTDIRSELGIEIEDGDEEETQSDWWPFRLFR